MDQNSNQSENIADEMKDELVFFMGIIKKLIQSKKIIIVTTLVFTISAFSYTQLQKNVYESNALIEIGSYRSFEDLDKLIKPVGIFHSPYIVDTLIEPISELIQNFNIELMYKDELNLSEELKIAPMLADYEEDSIVNIKSTSSSIETNNITLNKAINHIVNRHKNILVKVTQHDIDDLNNKINKLNDNIKFKEKMTETNNLNSEFINVQNIIFDLKQVKKHLENQLKLLKQQSHTNSALIGEIHHIVIEPKQIFTTFIGFILGFIISIFIVFFNEFIKAYRESA